MATYAPPGMRRPTAQVRRPVPQAQGIGAPQVAGTRDPGGNRPTVSYANGATRPMSQAAQNRVNQFNAIGGGFPAAPQFDPNSSPADHPEGITGWQRDRAAYRASQQSGALNDFNMNDPRFAAVNARLNQERQSSGIPAGWVMNDFGDWSPGPGSGGSGGQQGGGQTHGLGYYQGPSLASQYGGGQQGGYQPQNSWMPNQPPTLSQPGTQGVGNTGIGGPYGYNPTPGKGTYNTAYRDYMNLPTVSDQLNNAPNPQDIYNPVMPGAQGNLNNYFGGQNGGFNPNQNSWLNQAQNYMNNMPGLPGQPDFQWAPSSYQGPSAPQYNGGPTYDNMNFNRFNGNSVGGPGTSNFSDPMANAAGIGGPQTDYDRLYSNSQSQPVNRVAGIGGIGGLGPGPGREATGVARESFGNSGYRSDESFANPESVSRQGFAAGLGGAQSAIGGDFNTDIYKKSEGALLDSLKKAGIRSGVMAQEEVGSRGFVYTPGASGVSDEAYAKYYAPEQGRIGEALSNLSERQASEAINTRLRGSELAAGIGSSAASASQGFAKLGQSEADRLTNAGLTMRGQDIDQQGQRITERGQDINREIEGRGQDVAVRGQDVNQREQDLRTNESNANRALDIERLRGENYAQQTQRMTGLGQLVNQMEAARANNNVDAYNSATQRLQTEYGYDADMARNQVAGYEAATQRGEVGQQAWAESQRLGFDYAGLQQRYDELAANNQNLRNTNLIDYMRTSGDQANDRVRTVLSSMGDYANTLQQGQIANMENVWHQASLASDIMQDGSQAAQFWTQAIMNATGSDRDAFLHMWDTWVGDQTRKNEGKFDWGGLAGDVLGAGATLGGAVISRGSKKGND